MSGLGRARRRLLPERFYLWTTVPALVVVLLLEWLLWWLGVWAPDAHFFGTGLLTIALAWFAVARARRHVPYTFSGYRSWLATTPWTIDRPLPFGPIELDWPDAMILGAFIAVYGLNPGHQSAKLLALFFFLHNLALVPTIFGAANHVPAYAALFGLGLMVKLWPQPWASAMTGVVVYLIVYDGLRLTLAKFPEPGDEKTAADRANFDPATAPCGWPYDRLLREPNGGDRPPLLTESKMASGDLETLVAPRGVRVVDALAWGLLLGWWVSCLGPILFPDDKYRFFLGAGTPILAVACGLIRLAIYTNNYKPPISDWGRLLTLCWIIPGYDVIWIGPLLTWATPAAIFLVGLLSGAPLEAVGPTAIAATLFVALAAPPGLRRWRLIGRHRIVPGPPAEGGVGVD